MITRALPIIGLAVALSGGAAQASPRSPLGAGLSGAFGHAAGASARAESRMVASTTSTSGYRAASPAPVSTSSDLKPLSDAVGGHTVWKSTPESGVTNYATYKPNPRNPTGFDQVKRADMTGAPHYNKKSKADVPTPHVQSKTTPGGVRPILFRNEVPKSSRR